jgi:hypothetical protein
MATMLSAAPAWAQVWEPGSLPRDLSPWSMFANADLVVQAVMIGLAFASLVTWSVWLAKALELRAARRRLLADLTAVIPEQSLVDAADRTFNNFMRDSQMAWLHNNIRRAKAVLIAPEVAKAGFIFGGSGGRELRVSASGGERIFGSTLG